jgi:hypothetical protein
MEKLIEKWGYLIAGIIFLGAALLPTTSSVRGVFLVLAMAFLVIGAAIAKKRGDSTNGPSAP